MADLGPRNVAQVRVREGSALERQIKQSPQKTVSGALHDMAATLEGMKASQSR